jgi:hypothetical protein
MNFNDRVEDNGMKQIRILIGLTAFTAVMGLFLLPRVTAEISEQSIQKNTQIGQQPSSRPPSQRSFQGRGVAQGSAFNMGRNANVSLTIDRDNFGLELAEPPGTRARVQYRGAVIRQQGTGSTNPSNFTLDGRVRSFNSSANLRVISNTTGTCRIEVFDARVISSSCRTAAADSTTQFLGLEQF